jgi:hypothetical protein
MPVKPAFAAGLVSSLMNLLPGTREGQFLFLSEPDCST